MAETQAPEDRYKDIIDGMASTSHGSESLKSFRDFLKTFGKTEARKKFLLHRLLQDPKLWTDVKNRVWQNEEAQNYNQYSFIQGDIINTTKVLALGNTRSANQHPLWMVLSPDCDCIKAEYICVAPIYNTSELTDASNKINIALQLASNKFFPLPNIFSEDAETFYDPPYLVELVEPFFIAKADKNLAVVLKSITVDGWHILNSLLQEKHTRADLVEGVQIRINS